MNKQENNWHWKTQVKLSVIWCCFNVSVKLVLIICGVLLMSCGRREHRETAEPIGIEQQPIQTSVARNRKESSVKLNEIFLLQLPVNLRKQAGSDLPGAVDTAKRLPRNEREKALKSLFLAAARANAEFVARELQASGMSRTGMLETSLYLISQWQDSSAALRWAAENYKGIDKGKVIGAAL